MDMTDASEADQTKGELRVVDRKVDVVEPPRDASAPASAPVRAAPGSVAAPEKSEAVPAAPRDYSVAVGNKTGGQGKTLVTQLIEIGLVRAGLTKKDYTLASIDTTAGGRSNLGMLRAPDRGVGRGKDAPFLGGPGVVEISISPNVAHTAGFRERGQAEAEHFDQMVAQDGLLSRRNLVLDLGANVMPALFEWATIGQPILSVRKPIDIAVVVTGQTVSIVDAAEMIRSALIARTHMAIGEIKVVLNDRPGNSRFRDLSGQKGSGFEDLQTLISENRLKTVSIGEGEILEMLERGGLSLLELASMRRRQYEQLFGKLTTAAQRELTWARAWLRQSLEALEQAEFFPPPLPGADAFEAGPKE